MSGSMNAGEALIQPDRGQDAIAIHLTDKSGFEDFARGLKAPQRAALAAIEDQDFVRRSRQANGAVRTRFAERIAMLGNHGLSIVPSEANFLLVLFEGALSAEAAMGALAEAGYAVRHLPGQDLPHALRITIGTETQMDEVAAVLRREAEAAG